MTHSGNLKSDDDYSPEWEQVSFAQLHGARVWDWDMMMMILAHADTHYYIRIFLQPSGELIIFVLMSMMMALFTCKSHKLHDKNNFHQNVECTHVYTCTCQKSCINRMCL